VILWGAGGVSIAAPVGTAFTYQGQLKAAGEPFDGIADFEFSLFDAESDGNPAGSRVDASNVGVVHGLFTVDLDFGAAAFNGDERWLQIVVDGTPLSPRQRLAVTPYALQTRGIRVDDAGKVGIGTATPLEKLEVSVHGRNGLRVTGDGTGNPFFALQNGSDAAYSHYLFENAIGGHALTLESAFGSDLVFNTDGNIERMRVTTAGNVGIGIQGPSARLHVLTDAAMPAVFGQSAIGASSNGALTGIATGAAGNGVVGRCDTTDGWGVWGDSLLGIGTVGLSSYGTGVYGAGLVGVYGSGPYADGVGVRGFAGYPAGLTYGGKFESRSTEGIGVYGKASATTGTNFGVFGDSLAGVGTVGRSVSGTGVSGGGTVGVSGMSLSAGGVGVQGIGGLVNGPTNGGSFESLSIGGIGVFGNASATTGTNYGVYGASNSPDAYAVYGIAPANAIYGKATATIGTTYGVRGESASPDGYAGYFVGRGYFSGQLGLGTFPTRRLEIVAGFPGDGVSLGGTSPNNPAYKLRNGDFEMCVLGLALANGDWSSDALPGDIVLRATSSRLLLQEGAGASAMAIAGNNIGIGTTDPARQLEIKSGQAIARLSTTNNTFGSVIELLNTNGSSTLLGAINFNTAVGVPGQIAYLGNDNALTFRTNGLERMRIDSQGRMGINTTDAQGFGLAVNGTAAKTGGGSWSSLSDSRLKKNVEPLTDALDRLLQLRGVTFEFTEEGLATGLALPGRQVGLIAQEVEDVFPEWVDESPTGYKFVTERGMTALTIEAVKEQQRQIDALKAENVSLKARLAAIEALLPGLPAPPDHR